MCLDFPTLEQNLLVLLQKQRHLSVFPRNMSQSSAGSFTRVMFFLVQLSRGQKCWDTLSQSPHCTELGSLNPGTRGVIGGELTREAEGRGGPARCDVLQRGGL